MALNPPTPGLTAPDSGLRSIFYDATSPAKLSLIVQPGDQLDVSDDVAAQLLASSQQFKDGAAPKPAPPEPAQEPQPEADEPAEQPDETPEPAPDETPEPRKRAARRAKSDD